MTCTPGQFDLRNVISDVIKSCRMARQLPHHPHPVPTVPTAPILPAARSSARLSGRSALACEAPVAVETPIGLLKHRFLGCASVPPQGCSQNNASIVAWENAADADDLPLMVADYDKISQVILNLINNAGVSWPPPPSSSPL